MALPRGCAAVVNGWRDSVSDATHAGGMNPAVPPQSSLANCSPDYTNLHLTKVVNWCGPKKIRPRLAVADCLFSQFEV